MKSPAYKTTAALDCRSLQRCYQLTVSLNVVFDLKLSNHLLVFNLNILML